MNREVGLPARISTCRSCESAAASSIPAPPARFESFISVFCDEIVLERPVTFFLLFLKFYLFIYYFGFLVFQSYTAQRKESQLLSMLQKVVQRN